MAEFFHLDCRMSKVEDTTQHHLLILHMGKLRPREGKSFALGHAISRVTVLGCTLPSGESPLHFRCPLCAHQRVLLSDDQVG